MMISNAELYTRPPGRNPRRMRLAELRRMAAVLVLVLLAGQPACLFKKKKAAEPAAAPAAPARIVILPLNSGTDSAELRWLSLAAPVIMARLASATPALELVPLWQSMPIAVESAGASRTITPEAAAYVASRLAARWAVHGDVTQGKDGVTILLDFVPTKSTSFPFRYTRETSAGSLGSDLLEAFNQFLFYLIAKPIPEKEGKSPIDPALLKEIAEALDREHGWFVASESGKAERAAASLARVDPKLAPLVFNPSVYSAISAPPPRSSAASLPRVPSPPAAPPAGDRTPPPDDQSAMRSAQQASATAPGPRPEVVTKVLVPAPKTFSQRVDKPRGATAPVQTRAPARDGTSRAPAKSSSQLSSAPPPKTPSTPKTTAKSPAKDAVQASEANKPSGAGPPVRIQVGAFRDRTKAEAEAERLTAAGLQPVIEEADLGDRGIWHRVLLAGYASREAAAEAARSLRESGLIHAFLLVP